MFGLCESIADVQGAVGNIALIMAFLSIILGAINELVFPPVRVNRIKRLVIHVVCALMMGIPALYLWLQVFATWFSPAFSRWLDAVVVGVVC